jgi:hypothetical protein
VCDRLALATSPPCPQVPTHPRDYQLLQPLRPPWVLGVGQPRSCSSHCTYKAEPRSPKVSIAAISTARLVLASAQRKLISENAC